MTSTDIADTLGVSESSVVRFSRSLGYSGFMEFQKSLRKDYQDKVLSISSSITVPSQRVAKQAKLDTNSDYIKRHYKNTTKNLDTIFSQNATSAFDEAANIIINSRHKNTRNTIVSTYTNVKGFCKIERKNREFSALFSELSETCFLIEPECSEIL